MAEISFAALMPVGGLEISGIFEQESFEGKNKN
jgi:hypothetical protein